MQNQPHIPVMLNQVLHYLQPKDGEVYVDGTFGAGGYTRAILNAADSKVYAIDCDPSVVSTADNVKAEFPSRFKFLSGKFGQLDKLLGNNNISQVNGVVLDIGISSMQVDEANRGFSFMREGPLDMRMSCEGQSAADFINNASEKELADTIYRYGGEKKSRYIAKAVLQAREKKPITTTTEFAAIVRGAIFGKKEKIDQATRSFQAIRIWVNDELGELERALKAATKILAPNGRLVVVSFHSLEDSIIKNFFNEQSGNNSGISRHIPIIAQKNLQPRFELLTKRTVVPDEAEIQNNPRARSAKLRALKAQSGGTTNE
jgi:16S rRNA (cytosine1402-N4)-methyltransferase